LPTFFFLYFFSGLDVTFRG